MHLLNSPRSNATQDARKKTILIQTNGAHGDERPERLHKILQHQKGVKGVLAERQDARVLVNFDPNRVSVASLRKAILRAGFRGKFQIFG